MADLQKKRYQMPVSGSLAYDYDALERREPRYTEEREPKREPERVYTPRRRERTVQRPRRERQKVSVLSLLGFASLAAAVIVMLMSYAELTQLSNDVVKMQRSLDALRTEHVALVTRYEQTFDLASVKEAAAAAGMYKPSTSQIYYIDLSEPDSVEIYENRNASVLSRVFASFGQSVSSALEYFR